jgi:hypothetical protein
MWQRIASIVSVPFAALAWLFTQLLSPLGMSLGALVLAGLLAWGPWLRPPLSRDFRGTQIPWGFSVGSSVDPFDGREIPRERPATGVGAVLLVAVCAGLATLLVWPGATVWVFGGLLVLSTAACSACLFNHPSLIEFLDAETVQRHELRILFRSHHEDLLTGNSPDRTTDLKDRTTWEEPIGLRAEVLGTAWRYQMFGPWIVVLAGAALLASIQGSWRRRLAIAALWTLASLGCALLVCHRRGLMEYHLARASALEMKDDHLAAGQELEAAAAIVPSLRHTRRYWLAAGRLGYRLEQEGPAVTYFQAHQLLLDDELDAALGVLKPLADSRARVVADLLGEILGRKALWAIVHDQPSAAKKLWNEALEHAPWRYVNWIGMGTAMAMASPHQAQRIEAMLLPKIDQIGDRLVRSDVAAMVGDAYFRDGQFARARQMYELSMSIFSLPKFANTHAQEGMLGM